MFEADSLPRAEWMLSMAAQVPATDETERNNDSLMTPPCMSTKRQENAWLVHCGLWRGTDLIAHTVSCMISTISSTLCGNVQFKS